MLFTRNSVFVTVHLNAGAVRQKILCFRAGLHLRAVLSTITTEAAGQSRCGRRFGGGWRKFFRPLRVDSRFFLGSGRLFRRCGRNCLTSFFLCSVQFLHRGRFANLASWTRILLIGDCAVHFAFEHLGSIHTGGNDEKTCNECNQCQERRNFEHDLDV